MSTICFATEVNVTTFNTDSRPSGGSSPHSVRYGSRQVRHHSGQLRGSMSWLSVILLHGKSAQSCTR